jgi:hypothetical protein
MNSADHNMPADDLVTFPAVPVDELYDDEREAPVPDQPIEDVGEQRQDVPTADLKPEDKQRR